MSTVLNSICNIFRTPFGECLQGSLERPGNFYLGRIKHGRMGQGANLCHMEIFQVALRDCKLVVEKGNIIVLKSTENFRKSGKTECYNYLVLEYFYCC
jgi:hypothetical protein